MADKQESGRIPPGVGSIPVVGDLVKSAGAQAQWMQDMLEQNSRLVAQFPATLKTFNDSLERFNQTISRLDKAVSALETAGRNLTVPLEKVTSVLDPNALRELPETLDALRKETLPALRAAADTQNRVTALQATVERVVMMIGDLPGAGLVRRITGGRDEAPASTTPRPPPEPYGDAPPGDVYPSRPAARRGRRG